MFVLGRFLSRKFLALSPVLAVHSSKNISGKWFSSLTAMTAAGAIALVGFEMTVSDSSLHKHTALCHATSLDDKNAQKEAAYKQTTTGFGISFLSDSYRRRIFFKYERRLRMLSAPEKVFDYFASIKLPDGQTFMTASDLMRAVVPVFPSSESDLVRDGSLPGEQSPGELRCPPSTFFMLFDTNGDGLISFAEYIFLVTLLSIPEGSFSAAVRMFDIDSNGTIDKEEFQKVMEAMRAHTKQGKRPHDGLRTGLKVEKTVDNCGLVEYFFGSDGKKLLKHEEFEQFLAELHEEIIRLEFSHYDYSGRGSISAKDFALSMVASADLSQLNHYLECVEDLGNEAAFKDCRVTFEEFHSFAELRKQLQPLAMAINSYGETYGLLTKSDFQRAASQVCKVPVTDKVVNIVFYIFDTNKDGNLSTEEFLGAMERRERSLGDCLDSGIIGFIKCWWKCKQKCGR